MRDAQIINNKKKPFFYYNFKVLLKPFNFYSGKFFLSLVISMIFALKEKEKGFFREDAKPPDKCKKI